MKLLLVLLPLLGMAWSAPPDITKRAAMVKRAQEVMMYGNQQNRNKIAKKSDPDMSLLPVSMKDKEGSVVAAPAHDIEKAPSESKNDVVESIENELNSVGSSSVASDDAKDGNEIANSDVGSKEDEVSQVPPEEVEAIKELENVQNNQVNSKENKDAQQEKPTEQSENDINSNYRNPYNVYQAYKAYQNLFNEYPNYIPDYYDLLNKRRRRAATGKFLLHQAMKRTHRTKRDLPYGDDGEVYFNPYYFPETDLPESYDERFDRDEDLRPYMMPNEVEPVAPVEEEPFSDADFDNIQEIVYDGVRGYFIPVKEDIISNEKRGPYFYPVSEEPQTHFGAFVPEKREYMDSYERLVRLARFLAMNPVGREQILNKGYEWEKK